MFGFLEFFKMPPLPVQQKQEAHSELDQPIGQKLAKHLTCHELFTMFIYLFGMGLYLNKPSWPADYDFSGLSIWTVVVLSGAMILTCALSAAVFHCGRFRHLVYGLGTKLALILVGMFSTVDVNLQLVNTKHYDYFFQHMMLHSLIGVAAMMVLLHETYLIYQNLEEQEDEASKLSELKVSDKTDPSPVSVSPPSCWCALRDHLLCLIFAICLTLLCIWPDLVTPVRH